MKGFLCLFVLFASIFGAAQKAHADVTIVNDKGCTLFITVQYAAPCSITPNPKTYTVTSGTPLIIPTSCTVLTYIVSDGTNSYTINAITSGWTGSGGLCQPSPTSVCITANITYLRVFTCI
jgi:hypothetical protein